PLDRDKPTALPRQIQAHLERLIHERLLTAGMKLPATRELARQLGVNRGTVALAYEELVATGWARAHVGQGTFVAERPASGAAPVPSSVAAPVVLDWSGLFSRSAQILGADDERSRAVTPIPSSGAVVSFAGGMPDSGLFPTEAFRRVLNQVIRDEGPALLQYYPAGGYPPLRRIAAGRVVLQQRGALVADHLVQHAAEGLGRKEPAVRHAARERDDGAARRDRRHRARALVVGAEDLRAAREQAGPIEHDGRRDGRRNRRCAAGRPLGDEGALPHVRAGPAGRDQLFVRERDGSSVHAELPGELARGRQLHAGRQQPLVDEPLQVRLDLARQRRGLVAIEWNVHRVPPAKPFWLDSNFRQGPIGLISPGHFQRTIPGGG